MREVLNESAERRVAVLDPLRLIIDNYPAGESEECFAPNHPLKPEAGKRAMPFGRELWIEREDFMEQPSKGYHRLYPGNMARLRYGYVVKCTGCDVDDSGAVSAVHCEYLPDSKSGTPGADTYKVKGNLHWVSVAARLPAPKCASTTACSPFPHPAPGAKATRKASSATSATTSIRTACASSRPGSSRR
jgi:glutaminyl-tRNA synthetase